LCEAAEGNERASTQNHVKFSDHLHHVMRRKAF